MFLCAGRLAYSQVTYKTEDGHVTISGYVDSTAFTLDSHHLHLVFNGRQKTLSGSVQMNTFTFTNPLMDSFLAEYGEYHLFISGTLPFDIQNWDHTEQKANMPLTLTFRGTTQQVTLAATFKHVSDVTPYACMMTGSASVTVPEDELMDTRFGRDDV